MADFAIVRRTGRRVLLLLLLLAAAAPRPVLGQLADGDALGDTIAESPFRLQLRPYITMASNRRNIISMTTRPGDARLYVTTQEGYIFAINEDAAGNTSTTQFFNVGAAIQSAVGRSMAGTSAQQGLQSVAFHPDFNNPARPGYGKLYTTFLETRPANTSGLNYLGNSTRGANVNADGVLVEWTYNFTTNTTPANTYRELFRVQMPVNDHPIKQARFNPHARPGDEDYGLLYMTHGDSNVKHSPNDDPQHLGNALGKMVRIDPLQSGQQRYTIPATNPFVASSDPGVLKEIYAYGFRNPHTFSFNPDDNGQVHILVGDIGRNNIEEVNIAVGGGNYGWPNREGPFVHLQLPDGPNSGYITDLDFLPANEATLGHSYSVTQYDHDAGEGVISSGNSIASGFVIRNGSDPAFHNRFIFTDFSRRTQGNVFHSDFSEMLSAVTTLDPSDPARDEPSELTYAPTHLLKLALDHDKNPATPAQLFDDFLELLNNTRTDVRFGEGNFGEMYMSSKVNGVIYLVTNSLAPKGDFDGDGAVTGADFLVWQRDAGGQFTESPADANRDDVVDAADLAIWRANYGKTFDLPPAPLSSAVPEPGAITLAAIATCAAVVRRSANRRFQNQNLRPPPLGGEGWGGG